MDGSIEMKFLLLTLSFCLQFSVFCPLFFLGVLVAEFLKKYIFTVAI